MVFRVHGKRDKIRYVEVEPITQHYLELYLRDSGHGDDLPSPLFRPVRNRSTTKGLLKHINPKSVYDNIVLHYAKQVGITADTHGFCVHSGRATAATNALENKADIGRVQEWLGERRGRSWPHPRKIPSKASETGRSLRRSSTKDFANRNSAIFEYATTNDAEA